MAQLSQEQVTLLREPHLAQLVTLMPDGSPQISPGWVDTDGTDILINTALGRLKSNNMAKDARVAVSVYDPENSYTRVVNVRGRVTSISEEGADAHIDSLAKKYMGVDSYPNKSPDETRVIVRISPERISGN